MTKLKINDYEIIVGRQLLLNLDVLISPFLTEDRVFIITDSNVYKLYKDKLENSLKKIKIKWIIVKAGERAKKDKTFFKVTNQLIKCGIKRNSLIISLGGGVVGDLSGFVSSTLLRGINYIQIPTTLLSQVDSSIGSKTGINSKYGKNLIGTFYDPKLVLIDLDFLNTLEKDEYNNGIAEIIKAGLISDESILTMLEENQINEQLIIKSLKVKETIVKIDPFEQNERKFLNFGHTLGHAIENKLGYGKIKHGQAVALGIMFSLNFSKKLHLLENGNEVIRRAENLFNQYELIKRKINPTIYFNQMFYDKKAVDNGINFIFLTQIEKPIIKLITREDLYENFAK